MFWTLLTALVAAFAGAGVGLLLRALTRKRLPMGVIPVCAGLGMIAATVGTEYGWYPNVVRTMPEDLVIVSERQQQAWYQPWTFIRPWTRGFVSYSPSETVETAAGSNIWVVQMRLQERWQPQIVRPSLIDCGLERRAEVTPEVSFTDDGMPINAAWREVGGRDTIIATVCEGRTASGS